MYEPNTTIISFPELGISGAAYGTVFGSLFGTAVFGVAFFVH